MRPRQDERRPLLGALTREELGSMGPAKCIERMGLVGAQIDDIHHKLALYADAVGTDLDWRNRAQAALRHRQRELREVAGRLATTTAEAALTGDCARALRFLGAASALLPADMLREVWALADRSDPLERRDHQA